MGVLIKTPPVLVLFFKFLPLPKLNLEITLILADKPLVPGIAHLYLEDKAKHNELAAEWTRRFAR